MKQALAVVNYILFSNIFISFCAVMLCIHTCLSFNLLLSPALIIFVFCATMSSYILHAYFHPIPLFPSSRSLWIRQHKKSLIVSFITASLIGFVCLPFLNRIIYLLIALAILTFLYSFPRIFPRFGYLLILIQSYKVLYLAMIWAVVTVLLPVLMQEYPLNLEVGLFFINRFFFLLQFCLLFDNRDHFEQISDQRQSILKYLDVKQLNYIFYLIFSIVLVTSGILFIENNNWKYFASLLSTESLLLLLFRRTLDSRSDYWYHGVIDGLLLIPGFILAMLLI